MKKRLLSLCLAFLFAITPASASFTDITDSKLSQTVSVLDALGIMQGVGGNRFDPNSALTRAQFCKLAVTALGVSDVSAYGSYTIFPDVKSSHWAAQYINAAVRHPDLKEYSIIRGYADGTFGPDKTVNFGEVCTMLLRMLGYTEADIGPFWPADYIARAQSLGLTENVSLTNATAAVKRGYAATLLLNTLGTELKGDNSGMLLNKISSSTIENCILLATSETDSSLAPNEAIFYENGSLNESPRKTAGTLDKSLIGVYGTIVIGKEGDKVAVGVVPNNNKIESYTVTSAAADSISTSTQTLRPNRDTDLYVAREKKLDKFSNMWAGIQHGDTLTLYYDEYGALQLMAVLPSATSSSDTSFVYGLATSVNIPEGYQIIKNGAVIDRSRIKKYDVVTLDPANRQAVVSDAKISGCYTKGEPSFAYPQTVELFGGQSYSISDRAAASFEDIKLKDYITLLFSEAGDVIAAYPKNMVSADMQGIVTAVDGKKVTVVLTNGLTLHIQAEAESLDELMGRLVSVGQSSNGSAYLTKRALTGRVSGNWSIADGKIGNSVVSPKVRIYEEVAPGAPLSAIAQSDIDLASVSSSQIRYTVIDNAGTVTNIILGDVTGDSWIYGIGSGSSRGEDDNKEYYAGIKYWDGSKTVSEEYRVDTLPGGLNGSAIGIPKGYKNGSSAVNRSFSTLPLKLVDTVSISAFDGATGVRTRDGYYNLTDDIGVYVSDRREFISLQNAKANYTNFRLYANKNAEDGGKIRMIIAS